MNYSNNYTTIEKKTYIIKRIIIKNGKKKIKIQKNYNMNMNNYKNFINIDRNGKKIIDTYNYDYNYNYNHNYKKTYNNKFSKKRLNNRSKYRNLLKNNINNNKVNNNLSQVYNNYSNQVY